MADVIWRITQKMLGCFRLFTVSFEVSYREVIGGNNENVYCIVFKHHVAWFLFTLLVTFGKI